MRWAVESQKPIVIERSGEPYVVLPSVRAYDRLVAAQEEQEDWRELVARSRDKLREELGGGELTPPEDVLRQSREERDAQVGDVR
jgi:PHD/YefM family antitoxin component YafN of YafNO toxin-antitoxin module